MNLVFFFIMKCSAFLLQQSGNNDLDDDKFC